MKSPIWFGILVVAMGRFAWAGGPEESPRVVAAWASGPFETRVAFDRPIREADAQATVGRSIQFDETRRSIRDMPPPPATTIDTRGFLKITAAQRRDDGRTLVMTTDPHPRAAAYTFRMPIDDRDRDVTYDLSGFEWTWDDGTENASPAWIGWTPTLDLSDVERRLSASAEHAAGLALARKPGRYTLTTLLRLPAGHEEIRIRSDAPIEATLDGQEPAEPSPVVFRIDSTGELMLLTVTLKTTSGGKVPAIQITHRGGQGAERPVDALILRNPWVPTSPPPAAPLTSIPMLAGGDPSRGALVFSSEAGKCVHCHKVRGVGAELGPDLSMLVDRDPVQVFRDISEPSARINPNYVTYTVAMKDGRVLVGTLRSEGSDFVRLIDTEAKVIRLRRAEVEEYRASATSIMPVGLAGALGAQRVRDLVAFLTSTTPPVPPEKPSNGR